MAGSRRFNPRIKPTYAQIEATPEWRQHPLAQGLKKLWLFPERTGLVVPDIVGHDHLTITNVDSDVCWVGLRDNYGNQGLDFTGADDYAIGGSLGIVAVDHGTALVKFIPNTVTSKHRHFGLGNAWEFDQNGTSIQAEIHQGGSQCALAGTMTIGNLYTCVARYTLDATNSTASLYLDRITQVSTVAAALTRETATAWHLGWRAGASTSERGEATYFHAAYWDRFLSLPEITELMECPYEMFRPRKHWFMKPPAAGGTIPPLYHHYRQMSHR